MPQPSFTMKIRAERSALDDALGWVARALPRNPLHPVLAGVRVHAAAGIVRLSAFDYENQHTAAVEATVGDEGECIAPGAFLKYAVSGGRGAEVDLILDGPQLEISSGRSGYRARCLAMQDAPDLPRFPEVQGVASADRLRDAVTMVAPAITDDSPFSENKGVHIEGTRSELTLVATDRYRVHSVTLPWNGDGEFECTMPGKPLIEAIKGMAEDVEVGVSENLFGLSDGRHQWTTRKFATPYLQWRRAVEIYTTRCQDSLSLDRDDLLGAVRQVGALIESNLPVVLDFYEGELSVRMPEQDQGDGCEVLAAEGDTPVLIATNPRFLADAIAVTTGPIELRYGGSYAKSGGFIVADQSNPELTLIVMSKSQPGGTR